MLLFWLPSFSLADDVLHQYWDELLGAHVHKGLVDYAGMRRDRGKLDAYLQVLASTNVKKLDRNEALAFYINAYNSCAVSLILDNSRDGRLPDSIKDTGSLFSSPWSKKICNIGGKKMSLDDLEHGIIRPQFQDNRIHFAVNCASMSCPQLLGKAYLPSIVQQQLDQVTRHFLANEKKNYLRDNTLSVSRIFKWYKEDFPGGPVRFFIRYGPEKIAEQLERKGNITIQYLPYDWALNKFEE